MSRIITRLVYTALATLNAALAGAQVYHGNVGTAVFCGLCCIICCSYIAADRP